MGTKARLLLETITDPGDQRSKELRYRFFGSGTRNNNLIVRLFEASTEMACATHLAFGSGIQQGSFAITGTISNWGSLIVETDGYFS